MELKKIFADFENYKEIFPECKTLKHADILPLIEKLKRNKNFAVRKIGASVEGRAIYSVQLGEGKTKVLAWSQMHGDEPTATKVFFDFINFINQPENDAFARALLKNLNLIFIPMLNPDGAEINKRENALGIDINRDALKLTSPEAKILNNLFKKFRPDFALNLHDQDCYYAAGNTKEPVWISFLATVPNERKKITASRKRSMGVIAQAVTELKKYGVQNIARYNDEYEPRAFGDNFAEQGASVILMEAGCAEKNASKELERKIFLGALFSVFKNIFSAEPVTKQKVKKYYAIPENKERMLDVILTNITANGKYKIELGIKKGIVEAIGDLSIYGAYEKIDAAGLIIDRKIFPGEKAIFELRDKSGSVLLKVKNGKMKWAK